MDMGQPVRIMDLARDLIRLCGLTPNRDVRIDIVGRRLGEKLSEDLLSRMEAAGAQRNGQFYVAPPEPVKLSALLAHINDLRVAAATDDRRHIVRVLRRILPEYAPGAMPESAAADAGGIGIPIGGRAS
jgi:O-antigen biosynthesis protein WbqV